MGGRAGLFCRVDALLPPCSSLPSHSSLRLSLSLDLPPSLPLSPSSLHTPMSPSIILFHLLPRLIIADMDSSFKQLEVCLNQSSYSGGQSDDQGPLNPLDAQVAIIFDLNVLSQIANTSKAIIGVRKW